MDVSVVNMGQLSALRDVVYANESVFVRLDVKNMKSNGTEYVLVSYFHLFKID